MPILALKIDLKETDVDKLRLPCAMELKTSLAGSEHFGI